ncbi:MAG: RHS repeat-associated core domain-containing protein [Ethanoligenens sp.]
MTDWASRVTSYAYDAAGNVTRTNRPDGSVLTETYDAANRVTGMTDKTAAGAIINQYAYAYDADGNILTETSSDGSTTATMTYDANGRLTGRQVKDSAGTVTTNDTYALDAAGNITSASGTGMVYDKNDRLTSYNGTAVTYDADGNMTGGPLGAFSYDSQNRLTAAGSITYTYDAENNRVAQATGGSTTKYVYDTTASLSRMLVSTDASGNKTYYVYGNGLLGAQDTSGNYSVYHYDYRGSTTAITNSSGSVTDRYIYGTYGDLTGHTGSSSAIFLFNGRDGVQTDSNGLYYMRARYYSATLNRFVNADVRKGNIQSSESLNRYAYANGNPVNLIDPFGTSSEPGNNNSSQFVLGLSSALDKDMYFGAAQAITNSNPVEDTTSSEQGRILGDIISASAGAGTIIGGAGGEVSAWHLMPLAWGTGRCSNQHSQCRGYCVWRNIHKCCRW